MRVDTEVLPEVVESLAQDLERCPLHRPDRHHAPKRAILGGMLSMMRAPDGSLGLIPRIIAVIVVAGMIGITAPLVIGPILSWILGMI